MEQENIHYIKGKTWTTDAIFRETEEKINLRISEGCLAVEMEDSALLAVSKFRKVELGQLLYGGDNVGDLRWDGRHYVERTKIQEEIVNLSLRICTKL